MLYEPCYGFNPSTRWARRGNMAPFVCRPTLPFGYCANMVRQIEYHNLHDLYKHSTAAANFFTQWQGQRLAR